MFRRALICCRTWLDVVASQCWRPLPYWRSDVCLGGAPGVRLSAWVSKTTGYGASDRGNGAMKHFRMQAAIIAGLASLTTASISLAQNQSVDVLISGGTIYDGTSGNKGFVGDVAVT